MKFNYKKIAALSTSVLLTSMTLGIASAVSYPSEFSDAGNSAVVYGANAASTDQAQASNINEDLSSIMSGGAATVGDESFLIAGTGNDLTLGENLNSVKSDLDEKELPTLLAANTLEDDSVDFGEEETIDYDQKLQYSGSVSYASLSDEEDYAVNTDKASDEQPVLHIAQSGQAYNLTVDFNQDINATAYDDSETVMIGGKELTFDPDMNSDELILLESTETVTIGAGETVTIAGSEVSVVGANTDASTATISIDGTSYQVEEGDTEQDFYVNNIFMQTVPTESAQVELFVGSVEWKFDTLDGTMSDFDIDGESMDGVQAAITSDGTSKAISSIVFAYTPSDMDADEKDYLEIGEELNDPLFDLKMVFDSVEPELKADSKGTVEIDAGDSLDIAFTSRNGNEYSISPMKIGDADTYVVAEDDWYVNATYSALAKDSIFIASEGTGSSEETLVYQVNKIDDGDSSVDGDEKVEFTELSSGSTITVDEEDEIGDTGLYLSNLSANIASDATFNLTDSDGNAVSVNNELVTENGMSISITKGAQIAIADTSNYSITINDVVYTDDATLNDTLSTAGFTVEGTNDDMNITGMQVYGLSAGNNVTASNFTELSIAEDRDEDINVDDSTQVGRGSITATVSVDSDADDDVLDVSPSYSSEFSDVSVSGDVDTTFALSELGTYAESDNDENTYLDIWTPTEMTKYNVYFSSGAASATSEGGSKVYTDDESASYEGKNVVIVGGSCINAAAAEALGVVEGTCEGDFTDATGVGEGQFLIQKVENYPEAGKTAIVVAGYSADDTRAAAETLINQDVELSTDGEVYSAATKEVVTTA